MSDYKWFDSDIEKVTNRAIYGDADSVVVEFSAPVEAVIIHRDDVIHLAKQFGLTVYDTETL